MSWAKFDDLYDDNRKVKRAWRSHPRAVGLHAMAVTYCARHETDGLVDFEWLEEKLPSRVEREKVIVALLGAGLFERAEDDGHFLVHDYLEYNDSHAVLAERRARDAERKARGRSAQRPRGHSADSQRSPATPAARVQAESSGPDPTRPDHVPPSPHGGDNRTSIDEEQVRAAQRRLKAEADQLPDDLPSRLHDPARQVQQRLLRLHERKPRSLYPSLAAVGRTLASLRDRDHVAVADDVEHYWTFGAGQNRSMRDLVATYRNRLATAPIVASSATGSDGIDDIVARAEQREQALERQRREREASAAGVRS